MKLNKLILPAAGVLLVGTTLYQSNVASAMNSMTSKPAPQAATQSLSARRIIAEGRVSTYPGAQVTLSSDAAGTIVNLPIEEKMSVRKGEVIAEIRANDLRAAIEQTTARITEAEADVRLYQTELRRAENLFEQQVGTRQAVDRAQRDVEAAEARRGTASADRDRIKALLAENLVIAPISGTVVTKYVHQGESIKEQMPIVTIADLKRIRVEAEVDEFDAAHVRLGSEVIVRAEGYGEEWAGKVEEIPDTVVQRRLKPEDPGRPSDTRVLMVKVALAQQTPLKLGQRVEVEIRKK